MGSNWYQILLLVSFLAFSVVEGNADSQVKSSPESDVPVEEQVDFNEKFVPSSSWQKVKKGQAIPRGMHVRMNINTGETEAKLLDSDDSKPSKDSRKMKTDLANVPHSDESESNVPYMSKEELKQFLAKTIVDEEEKEHDESTQNEKEVKKKFRSYEKLKQEFGDINLAVKTDVELLSELVLNGEENLRQSSDPDALVSILTDIEYLVHQIDNAQEFVRLGGLTNIILPALNSTKPIIRSEALWLLGSASQSNPKVQIAILSVGIMQKLLRAAALDSDVSVQARAIYALSCLTRRFPSAQAKLVQEGGLAILGDIFDAEHQTESKTKMKILTLLSDFISERQDVKREVDELTYDAQSSNNLSEIEKKITKHRLGELKEQLRQYTAINLEKRLQEDGWCSRLPKFLSKLQKNEANANRSQRRNDLGSVLSENVPYRPEHDDVEKVLDTMLTMSHICVDHFQADPELERVLTLLLMWYEELSQREEMIKKQSVQTECSDTCDIENSVGHEHDLYYTNMVKNLNNLLKLWRRTGTDPMRDEL